MQTNLPQPSRGDDVMQTNLPHPSRGDDVMQTIVTPHHTHTHACTHTRARTCTHTHTHTPCKQPCPSSVSELQSRDSHCGRPGQDREEEGEGWGSHC